ncbi:MAG TPA: hypothetical protein VKU02_29105, partial [Gemmataceae bacterium]|nr:hypothetical protein [Gemmataceae bacterium]
MLDAVHWIGGSGNWSDPSHWGSHVPGGNDVAIIDATGPNYTVTLDTSPTVAGFMLNSATATFSASSGALTVNGDATLSAGVVLWTNSIWTGSGKLTNSANMIFQGSDTINNSFTNAAGATLRVQGASIGYGSLSSANGFTNNGTIELTNNISGAAYGASLTVSSGTLVNAGTLN